MTIPTPEQVTAVIPAFNPSVSILHLIEQVAPQVRAIIIVDDGSTRGIDMCSLEVDPRVHLVRQGNHGIAHALNVGFRTATKMDANCKYVLTLDQDTSLPADYVEMACVRMSALRKLGLMPGAVCASKFSGWGVRPQGSIKSQPYAFEVAQSGLMVDVATWQTLKGFSEGLFIDCVDLDFIIRSFDIGRPTFLADKCHLHHEAGDIRQPTFRFMSASVSSRWARFSSHSPLRNYYISRNRLTMLRLYSRRHPKWAILSATREMRTLILSLIFGTARRETLRALVRGVRHSLVGRDGRLIL